MPRPNPEVQLQPMTCYDRSIYDPNPAPRPFTLTTFHRTYSGGEPTPGFPRNKLYHNHSVSMRKVAGIGYTRLRREYVGSNVWSQTDDGTWGPVCNMGAAPSNAFGYTVDGVTHVPGAYDEALNRAMDAVKDAKLNLAQFIAERAQVSRLVADTAMRLARSFSSLRRGNFPGALKALGIVKHPKPFSKNLADNWLALQYGWKPLLSDVKGAAEHLAANHVGRPIHIRVRKKIKRVTPPVSVIDHLDIWGPAGSRIHSWGERSTESKCELKFIVTNQFIRESTQLGITDPLLLAWELVPYSFVIDWFLPIGDFLSKINYDSGLTYVGGCSTLYSTQLVEVGPVPGTLVNGSTINMLSGSPTVIRKFQLDRIIHPAPPRASFPRLKDPFSATHVANAMALLRGSFRPR